MESWLDTPLGPTQVVEAGEGKRIIFFHGGPGFDHLYLVPHFAFLADRFKLTYFDQLACGKTHAPTQPVTLELAAEHAAHVLTHFKHHNHVSIVAHSFGVAVFLSALKRLPDLQVSGLLINPVSTTRMGLDQSRNTLLSGMPPDLQTAIATHEGTFFPPDLMERILPHYLHQRDNVNLTNLNFNFAVYSQVYSSLGDYDLTSELTRLGNCHIIHGIEDFIGIDDISDLIRATRSLKTLPSCGHFPFAEQPNVFRDSAIQMMASS